MTPPWDRRRPANDEPGKAAFPRVGVNPQAFAVNTKAFVFNMDAFVLNPNA